MTTKALLDKRSFFKWSKKSMSVFKSLFNRGLRALTTQKSTDPKQKIFTDIYTSNYWRGESRSGEGSDLIQTAVVREELPILLKNISAESMLDIPCGDFYWMQHVELPVRYIGADIVPELIDANNSKYATSQRHFVRLDLCSDKLPKVDLVFSRDVLVHLSFKDIKLAMDNIKRSGAIWLLTTTFTARQGNEDIATGDWRTLNLQKAPFNFPEPVQLINEGCTQFNGDYADKSLGLWRLHDIEF
jgi:hypothetical protein